MVKKLIAVFLFIFVFILFGSSVSAQVNPHQTYTYEQMVEDIVFLAEEYPDIIDYTSIGTTYMGKDILAVRLGTGIATVFINGAHHAREWISTNVLMYMIDQYSKAYINNDVIGEFDVRSVLSNTSIWFVPMVNPDGVSLQQLGVDVFDSVMYENLLGLNEGSSNFKRWKANIRGVDLNRNYDCRWESVVGPDYLCYANYKGDNPVSELECKAIVDFTYEVMPEITLSYHSSGRVIFYPNNSPRQYIVNKLEKLTGYEKNSLVVYGGGYTDWFVNVFNRPGYTLELSYHVHETNPPIDVFDEEWERNKLVGLYVADEAYKIWCSRIEDSDEILIVDDDEEIVANILGGKSYVALRSIANVLGIKFKLDDGNIYVDDMLICSSIVNGKSIVSLRDFSGRVGVSIEYKDDIIWIRKEDELIVDDNSEILEIMKDGD